jgi:hypothetical protein
MEELQSTEILDREILEDARKKAYRILKTADETLRAKSAEWERKSGAILEELRAKYDARRKLAAGEIMARLPMDKRRARAETIEGLLRRAVENWYAETGREQVLAILKAGLSRRLADCGEFLESGETMRAFARNLTADEAAAMLQALLPGQNCAVEQMSAPGSWPEIVLENSSVRIRSSISQTTDFLLREKRAELAEALLGKAVLQDETEAAATKVAATSLGATEVASTEAAASSTGGAA